jgi:predicted AAA+ superfamily ATPase
MVAHVHGHPLNMSTFAKSLGVSVTAIRKYLNFFNQAYMTFELPSYQANLRKGLVKAPILYITDSGLLHALLGIESLHDLRGHPVLGNSWEGFVIQQVRAHLDERHTLHYFRTQDGSELDLIIVRGNRPMAALVITSTNAPKLSKGNSLAFEAVGAARNLIVTPSAADYPYREGIMVCSLSTLWDHLP